VTRSRPDLIDSVLLRVWIKSLFCNMRTVEKREDVCLPFHYVLNHADLCGIDPLGSQPKSVNFSMD
jgi:hypothetical protein